MVSIEATSVDIKRLKKLYQADACAKILLDYSASRTKNSWESKVDRLLWRVGAGGTLFSRRDLVNVLRQLQELGAGTFVIGRRGQPSRFQWDVAMISVGKAARGEVTEIEPIGESEVESEEPDAPDVPEGAIRHRYQLRQDVAVVLDLPSDLTEKEAVRLADFVRTLPFGSVGA